MPDLPSPDSCRWCGNEKRLHFQRFDGLHPAENQGYTAPDDALRLARMLDRRAARLYSAKVAANVAVRANPLWRRYVGDMAVAGRVLDPKGLIHVSGI